MSDDALTGWDEDATARSYAAFAREFPMYSAPGRDLARRAHLTERCLIVDLCGGTGVAAEAILDQAPPHTKVISLDTAAAMQRIGRRTLNDSRLSWVTARAEDLPEHVPAHGVDAVVCNSAIWKTDIAAVFAAVGRVLRLGGRFVFNIGGGFAGLPSEGPGECAGPSLDVLIRDIAARDYGYAPPPVDSAGPKLPLASVMRHLAEAGLRVVDTDVIVQHTTMAERKAWLSIPVFARPSGGGLIYEQKMEILEKAYSLADPEQTTVTRWLVVVAGLDVDTAAQEVCSVTRPPQTPRRPADRTSAPPQHPAHRGEATH